MVLQKTFVNSNVMIDDIKMKPINVQGEKLNFTSLMNKYVNNLFNMREKRCLVYFD